MTDQAVLQALDEALAREQSRLDEWTGTRDQLLAQAEPLTEKIKEAEQRRDDLEKAIKREQKRR